MADKRISFGFFAKDNGVERTLEKIGAATQDAVQQTAKLSAGQLELRQASLNAKRAEDQLATARTKLSRVTSLAAASDQDKRKAAMAVEAAEIRHGKALLKVADAAAQARRSVDDAGDAARTAGRTAGGGMADGLTESGKDIGGALKGGLKSGIAGLGVVAAAGGLMIGALLVKGIRKTLDAQDATAKFKVQLGLGEAQSKQAGEVAGRLYSKAFGTDMGQVRDAIRSVITNGAVLRGAMSKDLQDVTGKVLNLANTFDQDLGGVTRAVGQMLRTGMARDGAQALDILTRGFQSGADKAEDLLETFNEYPTQFRKLGLDGGTAMGLISQALKAGARDSDIAADAIKEFAIRAVDGSKTTADGFKALGLNAKDMATKVAAGGKSASTALDATLDALRKIPDPVKRSQVAVELFGTQAEDLGTALYAMDPSNAVTALGKVGGAAATMGEALATPQAKLTEIKRTLEVKVQTWLLQAFGWLNEHRYEIADGMLSIAEAGIAMIEPLAAVAATGLRVGQGLLYAAAGAAAAKGNFQLGKTLFDMGDKLGTTASKAAEMGETLRRKATPAVEALRTKMEALRSRDVQVRATENATKVANQARTAFEKMPPRKDVTITAHSSTAAAEASLNYLTRARNAYIYVTTSVSSANAAEARLRALGPGHAKGTDNAPPGWAWVGEQGPELMRFRGGEQVIDASRSAQIARGGAAAGLARDQGDVYNIVVNNPNGPAMAGREILQALLRERRKQGLRTLAL